MFSGWQFRRLRRNSKPRETGRRYGDPCLRPARRQVPGAQTWLHEVRAHFGARPGHFTPRPAWLGLALLPHSGPSALTMAARLWLLPLSAANQRRVAPRAPSAAAIASRRGLPGALPARRPPPAAPEPGAVREAPSCSLDRPAKPCPAAQAQTRTGPGRSLGASMAGSPAGPRRPPQAPGAVSPGLTGLRRHRRPGARFPAWCGAGSGAGAALRMDLRFAFRCPALGLSLPRPLSDLIGATALAGWRMSRTATGKDKRRGVGGVIGDHCTLLAIVGQ